MGIFVEGLLFGIVPVFFVGPVLLTLIQTSLRDGFSAGALVAAGIAMSDVLAVILCALGVGALLAASWGQWTLGLAGGAILLGFGAAMLLGRQANHGPARPARAATHLATGFVVNFVNPFVFVFWIGAMGAVTARHGFGVQALTLFFGGTITTILMTDLLKARAAAALEARLRGPAIRAAQRVSGGLLAAFGLYLLGSALWALPDIIRGT